MRRSWNSYGGLRFRTKVSEAWGGYYEKWGEIPRYVLAKTSSYYQNRLDWRTNNVDMHEMDRNRSL